jgi:hypothetical protein
MTVCNDQWLAIPSYPNYEVSNTGLVRNLKNKHILAFNTKKGKHPYQRVHLSLQGKSKYVLVHRLVLEAFVGPCPLGCQTLHLDDNPKNNHLSNLKWGTPKENHKTINRKGSANAKARLSIEDVVNIRNSNDKHCNLARQYKVTATTIQNIRNHKLWSHL